MFKNRISKAVIVVAIGAQAVVAASLASSPRTSQALDDFALRHPNGLAALPWTSQATDDFAMRHPTGLAELPRISQATDDFALRHQFGMPAWASNTAGYFVGSDYAQRHPELRNAVVVDISDYFLRHPEWLTNAGAPDDYFLRHVDAMGA